jgi:hypothetical protein
MRCECCTRKLGRSEIAHGIRYGTADERTDMFLPDRDSAPTVICSSCGELLLKLVYIKLNRTITNPAISKTLIQTR